jgi:hypothetical protein
MGWLDNSTNNIILDAVLTDYGRQALSKNDGSFQIIKFSLGDDEVDYSIIRKYGRTIGREKIEKNTPVFEAFTNQNLGLKYKMISVPKPLIYLPKLGFTVSAGQQNIVALATTPGQNLLTTANISVTQIPTGGASQVDQDLLETNFNVYVPDMFLTINGNFSAGSPDVNKISLYTIAATSGVGNPTLSFTLAVKSISTSTFAVYGKQSSNGAYTISTMVRVVGVSSGLVLDIPVTITNQP